MWVYREVSAPVLFLLAQIEPDIRWRTKYFRLKWGGLVEPLEKKIHVWSSSSPISKERKTRPQFKRPNNVKVILVNATISIKMISDETKKNRVIIIEDLKILEEDFLTMLMMSWAVMMMNNFFQTKKRYPLFSHTPNSLLRDPPSYCSFFAFLKHISQSRNY